jgi:hypothetical protein
VPTHHPHDLSRPASGKKSLSQPALPTNVHLPATVAMGSPATGCAQVAGCALGCRSAGTGSVSPALSTNGSTR